jgi:hypothetical protein
MANNVYSTIKFISGSKEAEDAFLEVFQWIEDVGEHGLEFTHILPDDEFADAEFMELNIGPKWAYITKFMGTEVETTSAWISPNIFFRILGEDLSGLDPDVKLTMTYVDEFYNFAGVYWWKDEDIDLREESGAWFKKEHDKEGGEPVDLPDYITDLIEYWGFEACD